MCLSAVRRNMNKEKLKIKYMNIKIGDMGFNSVTIPTLSLGRGEPKALLICGMHGNEISPLLVVEKLIEEIRDRKVVGEIKIVLAANSWAQSLRIREHPLDRADLNRISPGDLQGELSQRIVAKLMEISYTADLIVDLHAFEDMCPVIGIYMGVGSNKVKKKALEILKRIEPDLVWQLNYRNPAEANLSGALCAVMCNKGVPSVAVEMPHHSVITGTQIDKIVRGLINMLEDEGILVGTLNSVHRAENSLKIFERQRLRAEKAGLYKSELQLMSVVKKGDVVGTLVTLPNLKKERVISPCDGRLVIKKDMDLVSTGDIVASIGREILGA